MSNGWISTGSRKRIYKRDSRVINGVLTPICCYCGKVCVLGVQNQSQLTRAEKHAVGTLDHIVSQKDLAAASTDDKDFFRRKRDPNNLVLVCQKCNSSKQDTSLYVWCSQTGKSYRKILKEIARRINTPID